MNGRWFGLWVVVGALLTAGCGTTVGDPCTTPKDCGSQLCLNRNHTPGGYCTRQCVLTDPDSCPSGSVCVSEGAGGNIDACFLRCNDTGDCRSGYVCRTYRDSPVRVCVGPDN